jgi:hypothetical protein
MSDKFTVTCNKCDSSDNTYVYVNIYGGIIISCEYCGNSEEQEESA